jgi:NADH pyrophosphatase NudC (nudix superfamily)
MALALDLLRQHPTIFVGEKRLQTLERILTDLVHAHGYAVHDLELCTVILKAAPYVVWYIRATGTDPTLPTRDSFYHYLETVFSERLPAEDVCMREITALDSSYGQVAFCPFCGTRRLDMDDHDYHVVCQACGCRGPLGASEDEAVCLWNGRYVPRSEVTHG